MKDMEKINKQTWEKYDLPENLYELLMEKYNEIKVASQPQTQSEISSNSNSNTNANTKLAAQACENIKNTQMLDQAKSQQQNKQSELINQRIDINNKIFFFLHILYL